MENQPDTGRTPSHHHRVSADLKVFFQTRNDYICLTGAGTWRL
ncbi:MAG TPA: hypothetical protein VEH58_07845 [Dehalococcoidales bacterium]|nr:hypothetical protein [Dehalococcoidales bacterium]